MDEEFVKNIVMYAEFDPKAVMDLLLFINSGCNNLPPNNQRLRTDFMDENEQWLLVGSPNRDQFLVTCSEFRSTHEEVDVTA